MLYCYSVQQAFPNMVNSGMELIMRLAVTPFFCTGWLFFEFIIYTTIWFMLFQYNAKDSSVKLTYDPQPRPRAIATFSGKTVVKVACGTNHTGFPLLSFFRVIMINTDINPISLLLCCSCSWFQWLCLHVCVLFTTYLHIFKTEVVKRHEFLCICCMQSTYVQDITFFFQFWGFLFFPLLCFFCVFGRWGFGGYGRYDIMGMHPTLAMLLSKTKVVHITSCFFI